MISTQNQHIEYKTYPVIFQQQSRIRHYKRDLNELSKDIVKKYYRQLLMNNFYIKAFISYNIFKANQLPIMLEQFNFSILSTDYQRQLSEQAREQLRLRMVLIQAQWIGQTNALSHRVNCSTGFLISPNLVLTAAHNIFNKHTERFANRIQLYFLHKNQGQVINIFSQKIIMELRNEDFRCETIMNHGKLAYANDYAMIKIGQKQEKIKGEVEYLQFKSIGDVEKGTSIFLLGFPDFSLKQSNKFKNKKKKIINNQTFTCLKEDVGKVEKIENNSLYYHITTMGGQSGSPLFIKDKGELKLVGVHNSYNNQKQMGKGIFFTDQILSTIQRWIDELTNQVNQDRITRMVSNELQSFNKYANTVAKKIDVLVRKNYLLLGNKFRQTNSKWQSFWEQLQKFKEKMQAIYKDCSKFYDSLQEQSIVQFEKCDSQNSQIKFQCTNLFQYYYQDQQMKYNQQGQRCAHHKEPVYYYNETNTAEKFICNRCVFYKKSNNVGCMAHNEEVKFVQIDPQSGDIAILQERQIYQCKKCMEEGMKSKQQQAVKYQRIDHYYHRPISYIKLLSSECISKLPTPIIDVKNLLLSDDCVIKKIGTPKGRDIVKAKYTASQLLLQDIIEINQQEIQRLMFRVQNQESAIIDKIDKNVNEIQAMLAHFIQAQQNQQNQNLRQVVTFFEAFSDMLRCRSKDLKQKLLDHRTDDQECLRIIQKITIMKVHSFNQRSPAQLLTFLNSCKYYLSYDIVNLASMKAEAIGKLSKDIQSFIFYGGTLPLQ